MPTPKFFGIETEYNIYSSNTREPDSAGNAINEMIGVLKGAPWGMDRRAATQARCFLKNGGLIYKDMGAPEYCTPECSNPRELVAYDKAGERIVQELARKVSVLGSDKITIFKKSSDGWGNPSGCHENYSVSPSLWEELCNGDARDPKILAWTTFLAVRQAFVGGGKVGSEYPGMVCGFQMSQRSDHIVAFRNNQTLDDRPLIQTRNEPLAHAGKVRRLHVICGDANLCETSNYLKVTLSAMMLMALEDDFLAKRVLPVFPDNITVMLKRISRDIRLDRTYEVKKILGGEIVGSSRMTLVEILGSYVEALDAYYEQLSRWPTNSRDDAAFLRGMEIAKSVLAQLAGRRFQNLFGTLDWTTKLVLAEKFLAKLGNTLDDVPNDPDLNLKLATYVDMGWANTEKASSLYHRLAEKGKIRPAVSEHEIARAMTEAPTFGRAGQRAAVFNKFAGRVSSIDWEKVKLHSPGGKETDIVFDTPLGYDQGSFLRAIQEADTPEKLGELLAPKE